MENCNINLNRIELTCQDCAYVKYIPMNILKWNWVK